MRVHQLPLIKQIDHLLARLHHRYMRQYEQAVNWTNKRCHYCNAPVAFDGAAYCAFCCAPLDAPPLDRRNDRQVVMDDKNDMPALPAPVGMVDDVERHTSGIHRVVLEREIAQTLHDVEEARARAKAMEPPDTFTARLQACMKPGDRPLQAYLREMKPKEGKS